MKFAKDFLWGTATAAHQIEGNNKNSDWWEWEHLPGKIANGDISGEACDHWNRVEEDVALMKNLGTNAYRLSIEWAKVEPQEGKFDEAVALHYKNELETLRKNGIRPMVTLHHFVNPAWFTRKGGWSLPDAPEYFLKYVRFIHQYVGDLVDLWCTVNEPMVVLIGGYCDGRIPPGKSDFSLPDPFRGLLTGHARAYRYLHEEAKKNNREIKVGIAHHQTIFAPARGWNPFDTVAAHFAHLNFNMAIIEALKTGHVQFKFPGILWHKEFNSELPGTQDFIGVNYYTRNYMKMSPLNFKKPVDVYFPDKADSNDLKWEYYPEGFETVLLRMKEHFPDLPIYVTENGTADATDRIRPQIIPDFIKSMASAMEKGANVKGYFHWSLLDNFEWMEGFRPRFGLYEIDYGTQKRTLRKSGEVYREIIQRGEI